MIKNVQTQAQMNKKRIFIGVDVGKDTGFAVWDSLEKKFISIDTLLIHQALKRVELIICNFGIDNVHVRFEDARLRKWFGNAGREKLQGVGSVKRDSTIWEDFLQENGISFKAISPKENITKLKDDVFRKITGYTKRTNEHGRDAAMLIYKM